MIIRFTKKVVEKKYKIASITYCKALFERTTLSILFIPIISWDTPIADYKIQ